MNTQRKSTLLRTLRRHVSDVLRANRSLVLFILLMTVFRSAVADWNIVPTGSMKPTIIEGDRIFINKLAWDVSLPLAGISMRRHADPERGDIAVFASKAADKRLVKRVVGIPGDVVSLRANRLTINGERAHYRPVIESVAMPGRDCARETILDHARTVCTAGERTGLSSFGPVTVPAGHYLMMGDNRDNSADSRVIGFTPRDELIGRANVVVMSHNPDRAWLPRTGRVLVPLNVPATPPIH